MLFMFKPPKIYAKPFREQEIFVYIYLLLPASYFFFRKTNNNYLYYLTYLGSKLFKVKLSSTLVLNMG